MFTIFYKGFYVHGYFDKPNVVVQREDLPNFLCKSMHSAKCQITRFLNKLA